MEWAAHPSSTNAIQNVQGQLKVLQNYDNKDETVMKISFHPTS